MYTQKRNGIDQQVWYRTLYREVVETFSTFRRAETTTLTNIDKYQANCDERTRNAVDIHYFGQGMRIGSHCWPSCQSFAAMNSARVYESAFHEEQHARGGP